MFFKVVIFVIDDVCRIRPFFKKLLSKSLIDRIDKLEPQLWLRDGMRRVEDPLEIPPTPSARVPGCGTDLDVISSSTSYIWYDLEQVTTSQSLPFFISKVSLQLPSLSEALGMSSAIKTLL